MKSKTICKSSSQKSAFQTSSVCIHVHLGGHFITSLYCLIYCEHLPTSEDALVRVSGGCIMPHYASAPSLSVLVCRLFATLHFCTITCSYISVRGSNSCLSEIPELVCKGALTAEGLGTTLSPPRPTESWHCFDIYHIYHFSTPRQRRLNHSLSPLLIW